MNYEEVTKKIEPFLHGFPIVFGSLSAIVSLATDNIDANKNFCWIEGKHAAVQRWLFIGGPILVSLFVSIIVMWMIYDCVRKQDQPRAAHDFRYSIDQNQQSSTEISLGSIVRSAFGTVPPNISAQYRKSRQVRNRISMYYIAYLLTIAAPIVQVPTAMALGHRIHLLQTFQFILYPLQASMTSLCLFNLM